MKYETVWSAVDNLAKSMGLSPSGLAKKSGLDATTFNKSKRKRPDGKNRWPSLDSLNKVLEFCNLTFDEFYKFGDADNANEKLNAIPYLKISAIAQSDCCKDNSLDTSGWDMFCFPDGNNSLYALEIDTSDYAPLYKFGTLIILTKNSEIRRNDRVAIFKNDATVGLYEFIHRKPKTVELASLNQPEVIISIDIEEIKFLHRIVWASQ